MCWMKFTMLGPTDNMKPLCKCHYLVHSSWHNGLWKGSEDSFFFTGIFIKLIHTQQQGNISSKLGGTVLSATPLKWSGTKFCPVKYFSNKSTPVRVFLSNNIYVETYHDSHAGFLVSWLAKPLEGLISKYSRT